MFVDGKGKKIADFKKLIKRINADIEKFDAREIIVGCDSQIISYYAHFVIAIVVRNIGHGATFYLQTFRIKNKDKRFTLAVKLQKEVQVILDVINKLEANNLKDYIKIIPHVDIGEDGESRKYIKELVGWIRGVGYDPVIKPNCYAANGICNKYSKKFQRKYEKIKKHQKD